MDFQTGHMDYNPSFPLVLKCIFCYDFISIFFIGIQYMIHDGKKNELKKKSTKFLTNHGSDICSIRFKDMRIIHFFGLF